MRHKVLVKDIELIDGKFGLFYWRLIGEKPVGKFMPEAIYNEYGQLVKSYFLSDEYKETQKRFES